MALEIEVQTGERFTTPADITALIIAIAGEQLFDAVDKDGEPVLLNTGSIVWVKVR